MTKDEILELDELIIAEDDDDDEANHDEVSTEAGCLVVNTDSSDTELPPYVTTKRHLRKVTRDLLHSMMKGLPIKPKQTLLEFSEAHRIMPKTNAIRGGQPFIAYIYQREPMEAITDPKNERIVFMFSAQTGKSEILNNTVAYFMYQDPAEVLFVLPTEETAEEYVKRRIDPMINDNPFLKTVVNEIGARSNIMNKYFIAGSLSFVGSGSPSKLASKPIRILICDEVDRFGNTKEGSTLRLAEQRTATFYRSRKIILASTPTLKNSSAIEAEFNKTTQHFFHVPCHKCDTMQPLDWAQVNYVDPDDAVYVCVHCKAEWGDYQRKRNIMKGRWVQVGAKVNKSVGYYLNALYSPYMTMADIARQEISIASEADRQVFENTVLCKSYEPLAINMEPEKLRARCDVLDFNHLPNAIQYITCGVDVQADRLELEFRGWGVGKQNWGLEYLIINGDICENKPWNELQVVLIQATTKFIKQNKTIIPLAMVFIDSGYMPSIIYEFCNKFPPKVVPILPIKGVSKAATKEIFSRGSKQMGKTLITINTFQCKHTLFSYLLPETEVGVKYCHFNTSDFGYDRKYFAELTSESLQMTTDKSGNVKYEFVKERQRNEALDVFVYNFAASEYVDTLLVSK